MDISVYQHLNIRMSTRGKRPLRNLTPSDKVRAIQRIHNGETKASVSRDIGVPESTLRGWCKNEQKLRFMCRQLCGADQLSVIPRTENPPEKRPRFENPIQTPTFLTSSSFDEFGYNRLPLNGLTFPSNSSNAILEKIALNEVIKKHKVTSDYPVKPQVENISSQMSSMNGGAIPINGDFNSQFLMMQNINLLSLLSPNLSAISNVSASETSHALKNKSPYRIIDDANENLKSNTSTKTICNNSINNNQNIASTLSVKNWAKDPAEKTLLNFTDQNNLNNASDISVIKKTHFKVHNDSNNNSVKDECSFPHLKAATNVLNFPAPVPFSLLQIPNVNACDSETGNTTALQEWCKIFNASLNFLALAAAAAALQPNGHFSVDKFVKKEDNILYKELTKTTNLFDSVNNPTSFVSSDLSNDSLFESEPEDLSVRSTVTSKLSSPANSRSESPVKSSGSCSPLQSDGEH